MNLNNKFVQLQNDLQITNYKTQIMEIYSDFIIGIYDTRILVATYIQLISSPSQNCMIIGQFRQLKCVQLLIFE